MGPALTELSVADDPSAWEQAGFHVVDAAVRIGPLAVTLRSPNDADTTVESDEPTRGVTAWAFDWAEPEFSLDGITTRARPTKTLEAGRHPRHPNGVSGIDHVVVMTDDLDRTSAAFEAAGFEARRRRDIPESDPPRSQIFWWAGEVILELVGPITPTGSTHASIWGLALVSDDLDATAATLGNALSNPRPAVQKGRRIAAIKGRELGLSVPIAIMTPHETSS